MKEIFAQYLALWTIYYSNNPFGGASLEVAATYAAMDCMNIGKRSNWSEAEFIDDIQYWSEKIVK